LLDTFSSTPGDQVVTITIDPVEYSLPAGQYEVWEVLGGGAPQSMLALLDFTGLQPQSIVLTVPGRTSRFLIVRPQ
jgi:hypothetical protein